MKIKDYLVLKEIEIYLDTKRDDLLRENYNYSSNPVMEIDELLIGLRKVLDKLENED